MPATSILGTGALGAFPLGVGLGIGASEPDVCNVLFIQGLPYAWTDTNDPSMLDQDGVSGLSAFTIKPGLDPKRNMRLRRAIDLQTGKLRTSTVNFEILDIDGTLDSLFGRVVDGADYDYLAADIAAGTSALGSSYAILGPTGTTIDPADKHIGLERIGPSRERQYYWPFNTSTGQVGYHHPGTAGHIDPIPVTDDPVIFAGRWVTLYRFDKDHRPSVSTRWGTWAGAKLVWWGLLRDRGDISGNRTWSISCYGPEGALKRPLGWLTETHRPDGDWWRLTSLTDLDSALGEDRIAVGFWNEDNAGLNFFKCSSWTDAAQLTAGSASQVYEQINTIIKAVADGTSYVSSATSGRTAFTDYTESTPAIYGNDVSAAPGRIGIKALYHDDRNEPHNIYAAKMWLIMHEKVWKLGGFDLAQQDKLDPGDPRYIQSRKYNDALRGLLIPLFGEDIGHPSSQSQGSMWMGMFKTGDPIGAADGTHPDNLGIEKVHEGLLPAGAAVISTGDKLQTFDAPYLGARILRNPADAEVDVGGSDTIVDSAGLFVIRAETSLPALIDDHGNVTQETDTRMVYQIAQLSWKQDSDHRPQQNTTSAYEFHVDGFQDPRNYHINEKPLAMLGVWRWVARWFEIAPLNGWFYMPWDQAGYRLVTLLSAMAGTGTGTRSGVGLGSSLTAGSNSLTVPSGPYAWLANDYESAELCLGIPSPLIDSPANFQAVFNQAGGWSSNLHRVTHCWLGQKNSEEIFDDLLQPVGIGWRLHGSKYGVFYIHGTPADDDVDITLTVDDYATKDPPSQGRATIAQFNRVEIEYSEPPVEQGETAKQGWGARDLGARSRPGNLTQDIHDGGLLNARLYNQPGESMHGAAKTGPWALQFSRLWAEDAAAFWGARNFPLEDVRVKRTQGEDMVPGTVVRLTNPWPLNPVTGVRGLTNVLGRVYETTHDRVGNCTASILIYADSLPGAGVPRYAPWARYSGYDSATRTLYTKESSGIGWFVKPSWVTGSGNMEVQFYVYDRSTYSYVADSITATVESVDTANETMTFESGEEPSGLLRDKDYLIVPSNIGAQTATWVEDVFGVICLPTGLAAGETGKRWVK